MVIAPRIAAERSSISAARCASSSPSRRWVSSGRSTHTRLDRPGASGTTVNGPDSVWNSVEVSWCGSVWRKLHTSAGLLVAPGTDRDAGAVAEFRPAPVGGDCQPGGDGVAGRGSEPHDAGIDRNRLDEGVHPMDRPLGDRRFQGGGEGGVGDVVTEGVEADLAGGEGNLRRADQPAGSVDDPERAQRCADFRQSRPQPDPFEQLQCADEQRRSALVGWRLRPDQGDLVAGVGDDKRRGEAHRAGADHRDAARSLPPVPAFLAVGHHVGAHLAWRAAPGKTHPRLTGLTTPALPGATGSAKHAAWESRGPRAERCATGASGRSIC